MNAKTIHRCPHALVAVDVETKRQVDACQDFRSIIRGSKNFKLPWDAFPCRPLCFDDMNAPSKETATLVCAIIYGFFRKNVKQYELSFVGPPPNFFVQLGSGSRVAVKLKAPARGAGMWVTLCYLRLKKFIWLYKL